MDVSDDILAQFQGMTGIDDPILCAEILSAHHGDLELAFDFWSNSFPPHSTSTASTSNDTLRSPNANSLNSPERSNTSVVVAGPGLAWKIMTLPISVISGGLGIISGVIGLGLWAASGVVLHSLRRIGFGLGSDPNGVSVSPEAEDFVAAFEREYGLMRPGFLMVGFSDAFQRSRSAYKLLFVYLHSPEHPDTAAFCKNTLCSDVIRNFLNENFVTWGGSIRASEGFKMSASLKAHGFPFCAVVMPSVDQRITLLRQIEGPKSPAELLYILQNVYEERAPFLAAARLEAEERRNNIRLREEQDAAYRVALEADQARERLRKEEEKQREREAAELEMKHKEEEEARERAKCMAAEKAQLLGDEPDKGCDVTEVVIRFPDGERKGRRFLRTRTIQSLYDYVDSLGSLEPDSYRLVYAYPRAVYDSPEVLSLSLGQAGLHPSACLLVEMKCKP